MVKIMIAPNRYVQGPRVLNEAAKYMSHLGSRVFFITGPVAWSVVEGQISRSLSESSIPFQF
jgi:glycerol dehydrogenase-like iron-containing ADH family enzyme